MKNFAELASEVRQEPAMLEEGKKSLGTGWMLKADPKLGKAVKDKLDLAKKRQATYGDKSAGKSIKEENIEEAGLWDNIHAKRERIKSGSGERMRKPGSEGAPSEKDLKNSQTNEEVEQLDEMPGANMDTRAVHQHLKKQGWKLTRTSGSHDVFTHPDAKHHIPVPRHRQLKAPLVKGILKQSNVNEETDTSEKKEMAQTQLHFIKYAAEEILEYIEMGGEIEEWYQNKLSKVQSDVESLHSYVEGESRRTGMKEEVVAEEVIHVGHRNSKGDWIKTSTHSNYPDAKKAMDDLESQGKKGVQHRYDNAGSIDPGMRKLAHEEVDPTHKKILDKAKTSVPKSPKSEYERKVEKYLKKKYTKEEVDLTEEKDYHSVHVSGRHWKTFDTKSHAENVAKKIKGATVHKYDAERLQQNYAAKSSARNAARGKQWDEAVEVGQMSNSNEDPNAGRFSSGPAKKPMKPTPIVTAEQTAPKSDVPFDGPYTKSAAKDVKDKSGAVHTPMSRVKHLAKMAARKQAGLKEEEEKQDSFEKTNTQAKRTLSKTAGMVKDLAKNAKPIKKAAPETFQAEPELSSQIVKV